MVGQQYWPPGTDEDTWGASKVFRFAEYCDNCEAPICGIAYEEDNVDTWPIAISGKEFPDVPQGIASAANEAHLALNAGAARASVAMARAVVESAAKERGRQTGNLQSKIDWLAEQGLISTPMQMAAHEIRFAGNEVAHGDLVSEPISIHDATEIVALMDALLERIYQEPARVARVRASRVARNAAGLTAKSDRPLR